MPLGPRPSIVGAGLSFGNQACEVTESLRHPHKVPAFTRQQVRTCRPVQFTMRS